MPSTLLFVQSGGQNLMSGTPFSGTYQLKYGVMVRLDRDAPDKVFVGLPNLSGTISTFLSGGSQSSGGMADAMPIYPGEAMFIPTQRLVSGILTPKLLGEASASGGRVYWEPDVTIVGLTAGAAGGASGASAVTSGAVQVSGAVRVSGTVAVSGTVSVSGIVGVSGQVGILSGQISVSSGRISQTVSFRPPDAVQIVMQSGTLDLSLSGLMVSGAGGPVFNLSGLNHKMDLELNVASGFDIIVASGAPIAEVFVVPSLDGITFPDFASGTVEPGSGYYVGTFRKPPNQFGSGLFRGMLTGINVPPRTFNVQLKVMAGPFGSGGQNTLTISLYDDQYI